MEIIDRIIDNVQKAIRGKREIIELALVPLFAEGHIIFKDVPGVGKTTLASAIANSIDAKFSRIQFTSDLLPSDIIGVSIYRKAEGKFEFKKGPIFSNVLLADEINRASPKTQSALLEAMSERTVTVDEVTYHLDNVFFVIATENPSEFTGIYPLPESELDRFMLSLEMGYPSAKIEKEVIKRGIIDPAKGLEAVATLDDIFAIRRKVQEVFIEDSILDYVMRIVQATRNSKYLKIGLSTRGGIEFVKAIKGFAVIKGREFIIPDDVKRLSFYVLSHRVVLRGNETKFTQEIISEIVNEIETPI